MSGGTRVALEHRPKKGQEWNFTNVASMLTSFVKDSRYFRTHKHKATLNFMYRKIGTILNYFLTFYIYKKMFL